ncbi:hypothetical protein myaer87_36560 [Microcystis aeruginosa NIES-87]|nr:hypothetical protein myaer87_36560 [Microcystis aeruginosa NIES-87]
MLNPTVGQRTLAQQSESSVANSSSIEGKLDSNSQTLKDGSYFNVHTFQGKAGDILTIDLTSQDFDAYLILLDPNKNKITEDYDGGEENNAQIVLTLPSTGTYTLIVSSTKAQELGNYILSWREATLTDVISEAGQALELLPGGSEFTPVSLIFRQSTLEQSSTVTQASPIEGKLDGNIEALKDGIYANAHTFAGKAGETLTIDLVSQDFDTYLILLDPDKNKIAEDDDGGGENNARIVLTLPSTGTYTLIVSSLAKGKESTKYALMNWFEVTDKVKESGNYILSLREATEKDITLAEVERLNKQAFSLFVFINHNKAITLAEQALAIRKNILGENHPDIARSLNILARIYRTQGRYTEAESLLKEALAIYKQQLGATHFTTATIIHQLATLYWLQGRYAEAEPLLIQALAIYKQQLGATHFATTTALDNLALLYKSQGRYAEAEPLYQEVLEIYKQKFGVNHTLTALMRGNLALFYRSQGRYAEAELLYKQQLDAIHPSTVTIIHNSQLFYVPQGRFAEAEFLDKEAEPDLKETLAFYKQKFGLNYPDNATILNNLALLSESQGRYSEAEPLHQEALAIYKQQLGDNHPNTALSLNNLAGLYWSQDDIPQAINYLSQGLAVEEYNLSENLKMGDDKQKQDYMAKVLGTTNSVISLNLQAAPNNPEATRLALKTILERKGRILDVSTNSLQILRQRTDDLESQRLLTQLIEVRTQLSNLTFKKPEDIKNPEIYRQQINEVTAKAKEIEGKIGVRSAEFRSLSQPITLEGIQKLIPADAALVEIVRYQPYNPKNDSFGIPRYAVYILYPNGDIKAKDLGEAKPIDDKLIYFRDNLADAETPLPQLQKSARQLDETLMQPIRQLLGNTKTILLSPDAALNLIPFEALVDENNQYLVENYHITYLTSGRDLLRLKDKFASQQSPLIVADPFYGKAGEKVALTRSIDLSEFTFPGLPGTEQEAKAIKNILPQATVLTGSQATENAVKQVKKPNILHIATHGFFKPESNLSERNPGERNSPLQGERNVIENPLLRSGLVLAGVTIGQSAGDDGVLTALETTNLNLVGTKLVVLSACDTGKGDIKIGQGVYGLRRALVIAGSESQLISLWKVSDDATKDLMVAYYGRLQKGEGRSEALRQIQLGMLKGEKQKHPFYWASFIPSGDATSMEFD